MGIVPFIIFLLILIKKNRGDVALSDMAKVFMGIFIFIALLAVFSTPLSILAVIGIIYAIIKKAQSASESNARSQKYGWDPHRWDRERGNKKTYQQPRRERKQSYAEKNVTQDPLPKSIAKRKKIIENFNKLYMLCLTDDQIQSIANSSYMSEIWHNEVQSMSQKYEVVYEWFSGCTQWLRVYMYVFHVQEITSDINQQENIAMYAFEEVFRYADSLGEISTAEKIEKVNQQFLTSFDDATFMIAYRFLESKGLKHTLSNPELVQNNDEVDELLKKYRTDSKPGV